MKIRIVKPPTIKTGLTTKARSSMGGIVFSSKQQQYQYWLCLLVACCYFVSVSMTMYFPKLVLHLNGNERDAGLLVAITLLPVILLAPISGRLADRWGSRPLIFSGLIIYTISLLQQYLATDVGVLLYVGRIAQGLAHALVFSPMFAIIARLVPSSSLATGIGYFTVFIQMGNALGSFIGETLIIQYGFSVFFMIAIGISIVAILLSLLLSTDDKSSHHHSELDIVPVIAQGAMLLQCAFIILLGAALGVALQFMPLFIQALNETRSPETLLSSTWFVTTTLLTISACRIISGRWLQGKHAKTIAIFSHIGLAIALMLLTQVVDKVSAASMAVLFGLTYGLLYPITNAWIINHTPKNKTGRISGWLTLLYEIGFRGVGLVAGPTIFHFGYVWFFYAMSIAYGITILLYFLIEFGVLTSPIQFRTLATAKKER